MVYIPPVNIPDLSQRQSYASQIYGTLSGVGDAFRQNRVDKWGKEENDRQYARAIQNDEFNRMDANRRFALDQQKFKANPTGSGAERWYGNGQPVQGPNGVWGTMVTSNMGRSRILLPDGSVVNQDGSPVDDGGMSSVPMPGPDVGAGVGGGMGGTVPPPPVSPTQVAQNGGDWSLSPPGTSIRNAGNRIIVTDRNGAVTGVIPMTGGAIPQGYEVTSWRPDGSPAAISPAVGSKENRESAGALAKAELDAKRLINNVNELLADPNLQYVTGPVGGNVPTWMSTDPGAMYSTQSRIDQILGQTFLQAYNELRGAQAITEIEGQKATEAYNRLRTQSMSDADYRKELVKFREGIQEMLEAARAKATGGALSGGQGPLEITVEPLYQSQDGFTVFPGD